MQETEFSLSARFCALCARCCALTPFCYAPASRTAGGGTTRQDDWDSVTIGVDEHGCVVGLLRGGRKVEGGGGAREGLHLVINLGAAED